MKARNRIKPLLTLCCALLLVAGHTPADRRLPVLTLAVFGPAQGASSDSPAGH